MLAFVLAVSLVTAPSPLDIDLDLLAECPNVENLACLDAAAHIRMGGEPSLAALAARVSKMRVAGQLLAVTVVDDVQSSTVNAMLAKLAADKKTDPSVRALAIHAYGKRRDKASTTLALKLVNDPDPLVRQAAVRVLSNSVTAKDTKLIATLAKASKDPSPEVRADATFGLGFCACSQAGPMLVARLADDELAVRRAAAEGLCFVKHQASLSPLITALTSGDELLENAAVRALQFQSDQTFGDDAGAWKRWLADKP